MTVQRAVLPAFRRRRSKADGAGAAPVYWGRIGPYEAVTRAGILLLLAPEPRHPSARAANPSLSA